MMRHYLKISLRKLKCENMLFKNLDPKFRKTIQAIIAKYGIPTREWVFFVSSIVEVSMDNIALWINVCADNWIIYRFEYSCECRDGFGGQNCHLSGCGGNLTSQVTDQLITMPDEADRIGCLWNINSPLGSRINLTAKEFLDKNICSSFNLTISSVCFIRLLSSPSITRNVTLWMGACLDFLKVVISVCICLWCMMWHKIMLKTCVALWLKYTVTVRRTCPASLWQDFVQKGLFHH